MKPELSVLIATYNGAHLLKRTLEGYVGLGQQPFTWQILVVDNASTDETQKVLEAFKDKLPLETVFEAEAGKNRALNTGLKHIKADYVILSDDDSIPQAGFLESWREAIEKMPNTDVFGGSIQPLFDVPLPEWMMRDKPHFMELYALREGVADGPIDADHIFGPNMAVRKTVLDKIGFDESVGPNNQNTNYAMGSETAFCRAACAQGFALGFASTPQVQHIVRANQITQAYIDRRAFRIGLGTARKHELDGSLPIGSKGNPIKIAVLSIVVKLILLGMRTKALFGTPLERFEARWNSNFFLGYQTGRLKVLKGR